MEEDLIGSWGIIFPGQSMLRILYFTTLLDCSCLSTYYGPSPTLAFLLHNNYGQYGQKPQFHDLYTSDMTSMNLYSIRMDFFKHQFN